MPIATLATWTTAAPQSGPPAFTRGAATPGTTAPVYVQTPMVPDEYVVTLAEGWTVASGVTSLGIQVWVRIGPNNLVRNTLNVDLSQIGVAQSIRVQAKCGYVGVVAIPAGGGSPTVTGTVIAEQFYGNGGSYAGQGA